MNHELDWFYVTCNQSNVQLMKPCIFPIHTQYVIAGSDYRKFMFMLRVFYVRETQVNKSNLLIVVLWVTGPCSRIQCYGHTHCLYLQSRMRKQHVSPKCSYLYTSIYNIYIFMGTRGSVVGWGTMLQAGRSQVWIPMRQLDFSIDLILPAALWPWGRLSL
jgi:hypothetical protein